MGVARNNGVSGLAARWALPDEIAGPYGWRWSRVTFSDSPRDGEWVLQEPDHSWVWFVADSVRARPVLRQSDVDPGWVLVWLDRNNAEVPEGVLGRAISGHARVLLSCVASAWRAGVA